MIRLALAWLAVLAVLQEDKLPPPPYETRERHDPNGINKWYLGREIAHVMGPGGIPWLDRPERESEENPTKCIAALELKPGDVVADLGAGSGYYTFRMAPQVGEKGKVYAVEIQDEMIAELKKRIAKDKVANVEIVKSTESDARLPESSVDLLIMVDVYHELAFPYEVMTSRASVLAGVPAQSCFTLGVFRYLSASFIVCCAAPLGAFFFIQKNTVWTSIVVSSSK